VRDGERDRGDSLTEKDKTNEKKLKKKNILMRHE